jgi:hypothetical protein
VSLGVNDLAIKIGNMYMVDGLILTPYSLEQGSQIQAVRCRVNNFEI